MSKPRRQLQRGKTLERVRSIQELVAHQNSAQARATALERERDVNVRRAELDALDNQMLNNARGGVSALAFLRYQDLRSIHSNAVANAQTIFNEAQHTADERRADLEAASKRRRQAERLVEITRTRVNTDQRRTEQKHVDDSNCARAGHLGVA